MATRKTNTTKSIDWSLNLRFKVGETCFYNGLEYSNLTGVNSEPGNASSDWLKISTIDISTSDVVSEIVFNKYIHAIIVWFFGQSNCEGRAPISEATATELLAQNNILIWNFRKGDFEPLEIGVNNESGYQQFGAEISYATKVVEKYGSGITVYLAKRGTGNTGLTKWSVNGEERVPTEIGYIKPVLFKLNEMGLIPLMTVFYQQVVADDGVANGGTVHLEKLRTFVDDLKSEYGNNLPIVFGEHSVSDYGINDNFHTVATEYTNIAVVPMEGEPLLDAYHFNADSLRLLGNSQFDYMPLMYGAELKKEFYPKPFYYIRNLQNSIINGGKFSLIVDFESLNIYKGTTYFYIDDVEVKKVQAEVFGTQIIDLENIVADGNLHTLKIKHNISSHSVEQDFTAPTLASEGTININLANIDNLEGTSEVVLSPDGVNNGIHALTNTGGTESNLSRACIRLNEVSEDTQSFILEFDYLREDNSTSKLQNHIGFRAVHPSLGSNGTNYLLRFWANRTMIYNVNETGSGIDLLQTIDIPSPNINEWRRWKLSMHGFHIKTWYSDDDGITWVDVHDYLITKDIIIGIEEVDPNNDGIDTKFIESGDITIQFGGSEFEKGWFKDITITT